MAESILVIDDDKLLLKTVSKVLEKEGYEVTTASSGQEGIEKAKEKYFDLIILDVRMPGIDGVDALRKIRELQGESDKSAIIVITGYASEDVPIKAIKLEVNDYILKPFELTEFLYSVKKNIKTVQLRKERAESVEKIKQTKETLRHMKEELNKARTDLARYKDELEKRQKPKE